MNRRHDLDALRAFAMLLGIALHAALSFADGPWLVQDSRSSGLFGLLITAVHGFRMPLFFLLSGFFTAMLWRRRGLKALLSHRFRRVFVPLVVCMITIGPLMHWGISLALKGGGRSSTAKADAGTPNLWKACTVGDVAAVTRFLDSGSDPNEQDRLFGVTPLSYATVYGHEEVVRLLLSRGADVNATNRDGGTVLHAAAFLGRAQLAEILLTAGADATIRNERGETAVDASQADWRLTQFVLNAMKVTVEEEALRIGRAAIQQRLQGDEPPTAVSAKRPLVGIWIFLTRVPVFHHLWFLWFLCWMVAGFSMVAWVANRIGWKTKPRRWVNTARRYLWLIPLTMLPAMLMGRVLPNFGPDTSTSLLPPLHLLAYYAIFFGFGALYFDSQDDEGRMGRRWWLTLPVSIFIVYPVGLHATFEAGERFRFVSVALQVIYVWAMSAGMMGLFRRFVSIEKKWIRYLSDASYWMYIAHLPLVVLAQIWVRDWPMPALLKFLIVCGGVSAVLLVTYEYLVRYTWIGALLNGRKHRASSGAL